MYKSKIVTTIKYMAFLLFLICVFQKPQEVSAHISDDIANAKSIIPYDPSYSAIHSETSYFYLKNTSYGDTYAFCGDGSGEPFVINIETNIYGGVEISASGGVKRWGSSDNELANLFAGDEYDTYVLVRKGNLAVIYDGETVFDGRGTGTPTNTPTPTPTNTPTPTPTNTPTPTLTSTPTPTLTSTPTPTPTVSGLRGLTSVQKDIMLSNAKTIADKCGFERYMGKIFEDDGKIRMLLVDVTGIDKFVLADRYRYESVFEDGKKVEKFVGFEFYFLQITDQGYKRLTRNYKLYDADGLHFYESMGHISGVFTGKGYTSNSDVSTYYNITNTYSGTAYFMTITAEDELYEDTEKPTPTPTPTAEISVDGWSELWDFVMRILNISFSIIGYEVTFLQIFIYIALASVVLVLIFGSTRD